MNNNIKRIIEIIVSISALLVISLIIFGIFASFGLLYEKNKDCRNVCGNRLIQYCDYEYAICIDKSSKVVIDHK